jgi:hypothetical protein
VALIHLRNDEFRPAIADVASMAIQSSSSPPTLPA